MNEDAGILPPSLPQAQSFEQETDQWLQAFVGEKKYQAYYQEKFAQISPKKAIAGFNIGAFFFGVVWLFYRKMYGYGAALIVFLIVLGVAENMLNFEAKGIGIGISTALGIAGNGLYKKFAEKKIEALRRRNPSSGKGLHEQIERAGGTNLGAALALVTFVFVAVFIGFYA